MGKIETVRARRQQHHLSAAAVLAGGYGATGRAGVERSLSELHLHAVFSTCLDDLVHGKALRARLHGVHTRAAQIIAADEAAGAQLADAETLPAATSARLAQVLAQQQAAIAQLLQVLQTDARDLALMQQHADQRY
jgi:hypothetical protein